MFLYSFVVFTALGQGANPETVEVKVSQEQLQKGPVNREVVLRPQGTLVVKLEWQAVGPIWSVESQDNEALAAIGEPSTEKLENEPGAPEYKVYRFKAMKNGSVTFKFARPFGQNQKPKTVRVTTSVRSP